MSVALTPARDRPGKGIAETREINSGVFNWRNITMLTKTKIVLGAVLLAGFATAASAQQMSVEPFGRPGVSAPSDRYYDDEPGVGIAVAPGATRSRNVVRERDDFTGSAPRGGYTDRYADQPGNQ